MTISINNNNPWLIHVNVWQKPLQYYKVISLQLIKINGKNNNNNNGTNEKSNGKNGLLLQRTIFIRSNKFHLGNSSTIRGICLLSYFCFKEPRLGLIEAEGILLKTATWKHLLHFQCWKCDPKIAVFIFPACPTDFSYDCPHMHVSQFVSLGVRSSGSMLWHFY